MEFKVIKERDMDGVITHTLYERDGKYYDFREWKCFHPFMSGGKTRQLSKSEYDRILSKGVVVTYTQDSTVPL